MGLRMLIINLVIFLAIRLAFLRARIRELDERNKDLLDKVCDLKRENGDLSERYIAMNAMYAKRIEALRLEIDIISRRRDGCAVANLPENTIRAVKYAVKHSHPDNGGNAEDFIRFQKVYEEFTKK